MADQRRFTPPWRAEPIPGGYVVRDANGRALTYLYSRDNSTEAQAKMLTKDEARRSLSISHGCRSCLERLSPSEPGVSRCELVGGVPLNARRRVIAIT
jgi:uncharacterized protein (DUF2235 family)